LSRCCCCLIYIPKAVNIAKEVTRDVFEFVIMDQESLSMMGSGSARIKAMVHRGPADYHRGDGCRAAEEGGPSDAGAAPVEAWAEWAAWTSEALGRSSEARTCSGLTCFKAGARRDAVI
jgi:hypothetical protein